MNNLVTKESIETKVKNFFREAVKGSEFEGKEINMDADLLHDYCLKSVQAIRLISDIEVEFDIDIEEEEVRNITTLNHAVELIKKKIEGI